MLTVSSIGRLHLSALMAVDLAQLNHVAESFDC